MNTMTELKPDLASVHKLLCDQGLVGAALTVERVLKSIDTLAADRAERAAPIDMVLYCPNCGVQHIDAREYQHGDHTTQNEDAAWEWDNPPHRSHLCHGCGCIWRPADVPTNGVASIKTEGKADTWPATHDGMRAQPAIPSSGAEGL